MDILKTAWHYTATYWPVIAIIVSSFLIFFAALYFGIKVGHRWGEEGAKQWLKTNIYNAIEFRLSHPLSFIVRSPLEGKEKVRVQGVLELGFPEPADIELGLPVSFKFIPNKNQQKPSPCC